MRAVKATLLLLLVAATAGAQGARRRAIGWPFQLVPCIPGTVAYAPGIGDFAVSGAFVYFGDANGGIWRVSKDGGVAPVLLARVGNAPVVSVEVDATRVFFTLLTGELTGDLYSMPKDGGAPVTVATALITPVMLASDAQFIYWVSLGTISGEDFLSDGAVRRVAKAGGAVQTLVGGLSFPLALAVSNNTVYYGETGIAAGNTSFGLRRVPAEGGTVVKLFDGGPVTSIAADAANAYFIVFRLGTGLVDVDRISLAGGAPAPLVTNLDFADGLTLQGGTLYYAAEVNEMTSVQAVPAAGGSPRTVKEVELLLARLAFDDCLVYYSTALETIARAAR